MALIYKVFFKDRILLLTDKIDEILPDGFNAILKYSNPNELKQFVENFDKKTYLRKGIIYYYDTEKLFQQLLSAFPPIEAAGGLVLDSSNRILVMERLGVLDLPKGKCEPNETIEQTALREVEEECGIDQLKIIRPLSYTLHTYRTNEKLVLKRTHWFVMQCTSIQEPAPQTSEHITRAYWMESSQAQSFLSNTYASVKEIMETYIAELKK